MLHADFICLPCLLNCAHGGGFSPLLFFPLENMIVETILAKGRRWIPFLLKKVMHFRLFDGKQLSFLGFGLTAIR